MHPTVLLVLLDVVEEVAVVKYQTLQGLKLPYNRIQLPSVTVVQAELLLAARGKMEAMVVLPMLTHSLLLLLVVRVEGQDAQGLMEMQEVLV